MRETAARDSRRQLGCSLYVHQHVCVWSLWRDVDEGGGEGRLLVSDFINEGGNVFIPGLDTPTTFLTNPSCCVRVCWRVCVCAWFLDQALAQPDSQQCIFNRAFPPGCQPVPPWRDNSPADAPTALPTQPTSSTHNLLPWSWRKEGGVWLKKKQKRPKTIRRGKEKKKRCAVFLHKASYVLPNEWVCDS